MKDLINSSRLEKLWKSRTKRATIGAECRSGGDNNGKGVETKKGSQAKADNQRQRKLINESDDDLEFSPRHLEILNWCYLVIEFVYIFLISVPADGGKSSVWSSVNGMTKAVNVWVRILIIYILNQSQWIFIKDGKTISNNFPVPHFRGHAHRATFHSRRLCACEPLLIA